MAAISNLADNVQFTWTREAGLSVQTPGEAVDLAIHGPPFRRKR